MRLYHGEPRSRYWHDDDEEASGDPGLRLWQIPVMPFIIVADLLFAAVVMAMGADWLLWSQAPKPALAALRHGSAVVDGCVSRLGR